MFSCKLDMKFSYFVELVNNLFVRFLQYLKRYFLSHFDFNFAFDNYTSPPPDLPPYWVWHRAEASPRLCNHCQLKPLRRREIPMFNLNAQNLPLKLYQVTRKTYNTIKRTCLVLLFINLFIALKCLLRGRAVFVITRLISVQIAPQSVKSD